METGQQKAPVPVDTLQEGAQVATKRAKLVLKPPKFITSQRKPSCDRETFCSALEATLKLETAEDVLQRLLELLNAHKLESLLEQRGGAWSTEEVGLCIASIGKLAKNYREDVCVCCMLVHIVEMFGMRLTNSSECNLQKNFHPFVLTLVDHGELLKSSLRREGFV